MLQGYVVNGTFFQGRTVGVDISLCIDNTNIGSNESGVVLIQDAANRSVDTIATLCDAYREQCVDAPHQRKRGFGTSVMRVITSTMPHVLRSLVERWQKVLCGKYGLAVSEMVCGELSFPFGFATVVQMPVDPTSAGTASPPLHMSFLPDLHDSSAPVLISLSQSVSIPTKATRQQRSLHLVVSIDNAAVCVADGVQFVKRFENYLSSRKALQ
jgi:hypothetical protein